MRYSLRKYPYRRFAFPSGPDSYESPLFSMIENAPYPDVKIFNWSEHVNVNNPIIKWLGENIPFNENWDKAKPVDWKGTSTWLWEDNPFSLNDDKSLKGTTGCMPGSFTAPYWIARYLNLDCVKI